MTYSKSFAFMSALLALCLTSCLLLQYGTAYPGMPAIEPEPYHLELLSMNWGWDGRYDGEYKSISPNDYTWHGHGSNVAVLYNITPGEFIYN